jgi:delta 1-pyrroline-5-carboxylate dehydrogenase
MLDGSDSFRTYWSLCLIIPEFSLLLHPEIAPALACGNTVIVKPAQLTPLRTSTADIW